MDHATRGPGAPEDRTGFARYDKNQLVVEERRGSRLGTIVYAWDRELPVLYKLAGVGDPRPWIAWERHLRPATAEEAAAYEADGARKLPQ